MLNPETSRPVELSVPPRSNISTLDPKLIKEFARALRNLPHELKELPRHTRVPIELIARQVEARASLQPHEFIELLRLAPTYSFATKPLQAVTTLQEWQMVVNGACTTKDLELFCDACWDLLQAELSVNLSRRSRLPQARRYINESAQFSHATLGGLTPHGRDIARMYTLIGEICALGTDGEHALLLRTLFSLASLKSIKLGETKPKEGVETTRSFLRASLGALLDEVGAELSSRLPSHLSADDTERFFIRLHEVQRTTRDGSGPTHSLSALQLTAAKLRTDCKRSLHPVTENVLADLISLLSVYAALYPKQTFV